MDVNPHDSPELLGRFQDALQERYTIERTLGRGGMGTVLLARDLRYGRPIAIKVLHPELATSLGAKRFLAEIQLAANLSHPHIVTVFESGEAAGLLYYVMPYVEGESLRERLDREGRLSIDAAVRVALDVAEALTFAHARGVVHRDIKPENILLANHGHASVADFGVARAVSTAADERLTAAGLLLGSPPYISPEQADQDASIDGRADVYSLGCVVHEMLAGTPPFGADGAQATILRHLTQEPPPLCSLRSEVPRALEAAVLRALEKEPRDRFSGAEEFAAALSSEGGDGTGSERRRRPPRRPALRNRRALLLLGGVALAALLVFTGLSMLRPRVTGPVGVLVLPFDAVEPAGAAEPRGVVHPDRWLASALKLLPVVQVIDGRMLGSTTSDWRTLSVQELSKRAGRIGARYLVTGFLVEGGGVRRLTVEVYATWGERVYNGVADPGETPVQALDRMALEIVRVIAEAEDVDLGGVSEVASATTSLVALTELMQGQRHFWRGDTDAAVAAFHRSIKADSSFGPAYYRLSVAETWMPRWDLPAALGAAEAGLRRSDQMAPRWVDLLSAQRHFARRSVDSANIQFSKAAAENPRLSDAQFGLAEVYFHYGGLLGERATVALPIFEKLVAIDTAYGPVDGHIVDLALYVGNERLARKHLRRITDSVRFRVRAPVVEMRFGDRSARAAAFESLREADRNTLASVVALLVQDGLDLPLADSVAALLTASDRTPDERLRGGQFRLATLAAQGRWTEAVATWSSVAGRPKFDSWIIHAYVAGYPAGELARPMFRWAEALVAAQPPDLAPLIRGEAKRLEARDAFRALVHRATLEGDSARVHHLLRYIRSAAPTIDPSDPEPVALEASLAARLALLARDTTGAIAQLERAVGRAPWSTSYYMPLADAAVQRLLLARLLAARGDRVGAERRLRSFGQIWVVGDALFLPSAWAWAGSRRVDAPGVASGP